MMSHQSRKACLHNLFEQQKSLSPEKIAVISQSSQLTYRQLDERSNQIANYLKRLGADVGSLVGICVDRSPEMIVALLGILKVGAAYVPLDPKYPSERLGFIIEDTQIPLLIFQSSMANLLPKHSTKTIFLDCDQSEIEAQSTENPGASISDSDLAYVIYTSGSTGRPKGVAIEHRNAVDLANWSKSYFPSDCWSGVLASTSICFDLSIFEIFVTLGLGGTLILAKDALELPKLHAANQVKLINTVPSAIDALHSVGGIPKSVHTINLAGEPLQNALVQKLYKLENVRAVYNLYGPSEDTTYSTAALIKKGATGVPTIGQPLPNTQFYLLNSNMQIVPEGIEGEIYISGAGLARGYLNRPELTAERFVCNPFSENPGDRLYKTGDLALRLPDGNLKFLGRIDHQVKIRGFRIELGEIEAVLMEEAPIDKVVVVARDDEDSSPRLVAYVIPKDVQANNVTPHKLRGLLTEKLPVHMVPSAFVILDELPLTPNGKIDRRALPIPTWNCSERGDFMAPATEVELRVAEIWSRILKLDAIGIHETFCSLGGHSLISLQLLHEINQNFGLEVSMSSFLERPTIAGMAKTIESIRKNENMLEEIDFAEEAQLDQTISLPQQPQAGVPHIFLTGATGFLGVYLLAELLQQTRGDIYCLVRATSVAEGSARIKRALQRYQIWEDSFESRIIPVMGSLALPRFGIQAEAFDRLAEKLDVIYHCGAWVNTIYPYSVLKPANVTGSEEILRLASKSRVKPVHYISTVDVFEGSNTLEIRTIREREEIASPPMLYSGYAKSKCVAESLMRTAHQRGIPVTIYRPSNVMGDSYLGLSSVASFITQMIKGCLQISAAPQFNAALNLIPVDYASQAIVHLSLCESSIGESFNIVNPQSLMWNDLVIWMKEVGYQFEMLDYEKWCAKAISMASSDPGDAVFFLTTFLTNKPFIQKSLGAFHFEYSDTYQRLESTGIRCPKIGDEMLSAYFQAFFETDVIDFPPSPKQTSHSEQPLQAAL